MGLSTPQEPSASLLQFTDDEVGNLKGDELTSNLKAIGFPHTGYNAAEKKNLWYLTCKSKEQR